MRLKSVRRVGEHKLTVATCVGNSPSLALRSADRMAQHLNVCGFRVSITPNQKPATRRAFAVEWPLVFAAPASYFRLLPILLLGIVFRDVKDGKLRYKLLGLGPQSRGKRIERDVFDNAVNRMLGRRHPDCPLWRIFLNVRR